jgi:hypothetical protein
MMLVKMQEPFLTSPDKPFEPLDCLELTDPAITEFMTGEGVKYLLPFFNKEASLSEATKSVKVSIAKLRYWVDKMQTFGLIRETRRVERKGSPIRYYRSVADEFRIPVSSIPLVSLEEMLETRERRYVKRLYKVTANAITRHSHKKGDAWYLRFYMQDSHGTAAIEPEQGTPEDAKIFSYWMPLSLSPEQAKALRAELRDIQTRYAQMNIDNHNAYPLSLVHLFAVEEG